MGLITAFLSFKINCLIEFYRNVGIHHTHINIKLPTNVQITHKCNINIRVNNKDTFLIAKLRHYNYKFEVTTMCR